MVVPLGQGYPIVPKYEFYAIKKHFLRSFEMPQKKILILGQIGIFWGNNFLKTEILVFFSILQKTTKKP